MLYAKSPGSENRVQATPGDRATCPVCGESVIAKCGEINAWHWSHQADADCDPWNEGESAWHLAWKARVAPSCCEVTIGPHRADIVSTTGTIIELQHSSLSPDKVREREAFYKEMVWLVDASEFEERFRVRVRDRYESFRWATPRKWTFAITKPLFFDLRHDCIFCIKKLHPSEPPGFTTYTRHDGSIGGMATERQLCGGWGWSMTEQQFVDRWITPVPPAKRIQYGSSQGGAVLPGF